MTDTTPKHTAEQIQELLKATRERKITEEEIKAFEKRVAKREAEFEEAAKRQRATLEWLNRQYDI